MSCLREVDGVAIVIFLRMLIVITEGCWLPRSPPDSFFQDVPPKSCASAER